MEHDEGPSDQPIDPVDDLDALELQESQQEGQAPGGRTLAEVYLKQFAPLYTSAFEKFARELAGHMLKTNDLLPQTANFMMSALGSHGQASLEALQKSIGEALAVQREERRAEWASLFESIRRLIERTLPPNWNGIQYPGLQVIERILLDEGIPLAWVPAQPTLQVLLDATDNIDRRQVLGRRWRQVAADCESVLDGIHCPDLAENRAFAHHIVDALRSGHPAAAQALAANLLDSILCRHFDEDALRAATRNRAGRPRFDLKAYQVRYALTVGPIWRAYAEYWEHRGDRIPRNFGRHPSAHAVSRTQYSRINAMTALMLVASVLSFLDAEYSR